MPLNPEMSEEEERALIEKYRLMPAWQKIEEVVRLTEAYRAKIIAGLRERYPQASEQELRLRMATLLYGRELILKAYGWASEDEDDRDLL